MNEQLQQALTAAIQQGTDMLSSGTTFLQAQLPDVITQLLLWKLTWACVRTVILVILCVGAVFAFRIGMRWVVQYRLAVGAYLRASRGSIDEREAKATMNEAENYAPGGWIIMIATAVFSAFMVLGIIVGIADIIQITLAPKLYLIEYAANLAK